MSKRIGYAVLMAWVLTAPTLAQAQEQGQDLTRDRSLIDAAFATLSDVQNASFDGNREYCGMIGRNARGKLVVTRPRAGKATSCRPKSFSFLRGDIEYLASYHTHGGHDPDHDSEVPSVDDLYADGVEGVIGFVATPGGRLWVTDPARDEVRLICGPRCLPVDAQYKQADDGTVRQRYTASELHARAQHIERYSDQNFARNRHHDRSRGLDE